MTSPLPLTGITVFELGHSVAAPFAGSILAQLGAEVIKVEQPVTGDATRDWGPPYRGGTAVAFEAYNCGKKSVTANLKDRDQGSRLRRAILARADVVIQNLKPGSIERLGLGARELTREKPSLIYCNLSAFGHTGPLSSKPGYDPLMQAYGGLMSINGEDGRPPVRVATSIIDMGAGMWSVIAILAALIERQRTNAGGTVDTSLYEAAIAWMTMPLDGFLASNQVPGRWGSAVPQIVPYQIFPTADGCLMVGVGNDSLFERFSAVLGRSDWCDDPRFATNGDRVRNRGTLISEIEAIMQSEASTVWMDRFDAAEIPNAPLQTVDEVAANPQTEALGIIQSVGQDGRRLVGLPLSFDQTRPPLRAAPPELGRDNWLLEREPKAETATR